MHYGSAARRLRPFVRALASVTLLLCTVGGALAAAGPIPATDQQAQSAATRTFLPLLRAQNTNPPPPPPPPTKQSIFLDRTVKTASAATVADANGGFHAAHINYVPSAENPPAVYDYCAANCANAASWQHVALSSRAREVQLALTPAGKPRLLIVTDSVVYSGGKDYNYAECNSSCTSAAGWTVTRTFSSDGTAIIDIGQDRTPQRSFALDPQGRPRFFYQDRNYLIEPDHYGGFYAFCDTNCASAASWKQTEVGRFINYDAEILDLPSLTFTSSGQPRVISRVFAKNPDGSSAETGLYYYECDAGCDKTASWQRVYLIPTGVGSYPNPSWDIELDANNRPRVVIFTGKDLQPAEYNNTIVYLWCDASCLDANSWQLDNVALGNADGEAPDLELTAAGLPRIAYVDHLGQLGYAWCNTSCTADGAQWQHKVVETESDVRKEFPQAIPLNCDADVWDGLAPVLDLDGAGTPRIAYDLAVEARCLYDDPNDNQPPYHRFMPVWRAARVVSFPQP